MSCKFLPGQFLQLPSSSLAFCGKCHHPAPRSTGWPFHCTATPCMLWRWGPGKGFFYRSNHVLLIGNNIPCQKQCMHDNACQQSVNIYPCIINSCICIYTTWMDASLTNDSGNLWQYCTMLLMDAALHLLVFLISSSVIHFPLVSVSRLSRRSRMMRHFVTKSACSQQAWPALDGKWMKSHDGKNESQKL